MRYVKQKIIKCNLCGELFEGKYNNKKSVCNVCYYKRRYIHTKPAIEDIIKLILNYQDEHPNYHLRINDKKYNMLVKEADFRLKV